MRSAAVVCALLVCLLVIGGAGPVAAGITFVDIAAEAGVDYIGDWVFFGSGAAMVDFDGDGDLDIYAGNGDGQPNHLFRNDGDLHFVDVAAAAGVDFTGAAQAVVFGDYDNDGDPDLFVTREEQATGLYRNDGGVFTDVTGAAGLGSIGSYTGAAWGDLDADGYLDLYVVNYYWEQNQCYKNNGNGTFTEIASAVGVDHSTYGFQPALFDYDNDGDLDIYVSNDKLTGNLLYRNDGPWVFTDVSQPSGSDVEVCGMGLTTGDFDNNGYLDMYVTSGIDGHPLLKNLGDGTFEEVSEEMGAALYQNGWGTEFFDADLDGDLDLHVLHYYQGGLPPDHEYDVFLENPGDGPFVDISIAAGVDDPRSGYGLAIGDIDRDGRPDMFATHRNEPAALWLNTSDVGGNHWLAIEAEGVWSNRDGIGARVTVSAGGKTQVRQIMAGTAYLSQGERVARFGLGPATMVDWVRIDWPSGLTDVLANVPADQKVHAVEGTTAAGLNEEGPRVDRLRAYPNPSRGSVTFSFPRADTHPSAPSMTEPTMLLILDGRGRLIRRLRGGDHLVGTEFVRWDGRAENGRPVPAGVYLYQTRSSGPTASVRASSEPAASGKIVIR